jgi:acyl carrier protein
LDGRREPAAVGVPGELYIGGEGLARGYLHSPELTAERFTPDPFGATPGGRLYRTGDVARYLAGGEVEFLGRRDGQVKIRGYRVEVGEVEAALRGHEGVRDAVVAARGDVAGHKALAAYVVAAGGVELRAGELRAWLKARLPEYMVPGAIVMLEELPLNTNGKFDRRALPDPEQNAGERESAFALPRTPIEEKLSEIFSSVLGQRSVSVSDNFFDLGGHSLMATQVISRIRERLKVELPLRSLFMSPTVTGLSEVIEEELKTGKNVTAPAITRVSRAGFRATVSPDGSLRIPDVLKTTLGGEQ